MDKIKEVFLLYWLDDKNPPNFNIPKLYAISHYPEMICVFSTLIKTTIEYSERVYIPQKNFYWKLNKCEGYKEQIIYFNIKLTNTIVIQEIEL
jgi:hypothetical protein